MLNHFLMGLLGAFIMWWLSVGLRILFEDRDAIFDELMGRWGATLADRLWTVLLVILTLLTGPIMLAEAGLR